VVFTGKMLTTAGKMQNQNNNHTPMNAQNMGAGGGGPDTKTMISINNLVYNLEPDLSTVSNATHKQHFFQQNDYKSSQRATCILNTGADYVDTRRSWLVFSLELLEAPAAGVQFGPYGSALNLINRVTVSSRSGDELSRCRRLNLKKASILPYKMDTEWWESVGQSMGKGKIMKKGGLSHRFVIPLYCLSDLFGYGRFIPSMLTSGMRIEIEWENAEIAFAPIEDNVIDSFTYTIHDLHINARSVQLTDACQRYLNELSSSSGLEIVYTDWETTEQTNVSGGQINLEVRKAASRALKAYGKIVDNAEEGTRDSMASCLFSCTQHQWQLGSLYFPQQPIKTSFDGDAFYASQESYLHCLDSFVAKSGIYKSAMPFDPPPGELLESFTKESERKITRLEATEEEKSLFYTGAACVLISVDRPPLIRVVESVEFEAEVEAVPNQSVRVPPKLKVTFFKDIPAGSYIYNLIRLNPQARRQSAFGAESSFQTNGSLLACCLERSALFNLSGIPINNSRILLLRATLAKRTEVDVTIFLQYVKLARIFMSNCEVEE